MRPSLRGHRAPLPGTEPLLVALQEAAAELAGIPAVLLGGLAMQRYGSLRLTQDIDLAVERLPRGVGGSPLVFGGVTRNLPRSGVECDYIVREDDYAELYEAAIASGVADAVLPSSVRLVQKEYLAAMKLAAGRAKDLDDLAFLVVDGGLNINRTRLIIRKYLGAFAAQTFDSEVEVARWTAKSGRRAPRRGPCR